MLKKVALGSFACLALIAGSAQATQIPSNLSVSATVVGTCTFTTPNAIAFGNVTSTSAQFDLAAVNVLVNCTTGTPYTIGMDFGLGGTFGSRDMQSGANRLKYNVFTDNARSIAFTAVGAFGTVGNFSGNGTNSSVSVPIYPSILTQSTPATGAYTDTLVVTLQY